MGFNWGGAGSGAAGGAAAGSAFGPWGAAIGGVGGGLLGGLAGSMDRTRGYEGPNRAEFNVPGYNTQYGQLGSFAHAANDRAAPVSAFRGNQVGLGRILGAEARGQGVGQQLVAKNAQLAADRASATQFSALAGARPGMQAMASRNAMLGSALAQSAVGEQAAVGSAQMTLGAQQQYGQFLQGARGQDEETELRRRQMNDQAVLEAMRQRGQLAVAQQTGGMNYEQLRAGRANALLGTPTQGEIMTGGIVGLGSAIYGMGQRRDQQQAQQAQPYGAVNPTPNYTLGSGQLQPPPSYANLTAPQPAPFSVGTGVQLEPPKYRPPGRG
jgi:hypothetical protein